MKFLNAIHQKLVFFALIFVAQISLAQNPTIINDSLVVRQRLYAKEKLIVEKDATFKQAVNVIGNLSSTGNTRLSGAFEVTGAAKMSGTVTMDGIGAPVTIDSTLQFLVILPNGQIKKIDGGSVNKTTPPNTSCIGNVTNPLWTSGVNKIYSLCPIVKVGIGTSTPGYSLTVEGTAYSQKVLAGSASGSTSALINAFLPSNSGDLIRLGVMNVTTPVVRFVISNDGETELTNVGADVTLSIRNGTGQAIVVKSNAGSKILQLEDNGLLRTREIRVDANTWADFVFDENYNLPTLKDVANFIQINHHLPGMPADAEVKQNGINVGEMQKLHLQKIEELTLYLIEMDKKLNVMQEEIDALKKENAQLKNTK